MRWSIKLGQAAGTAVRLHLTFLLLVAWIAAVYWMRGGPVAALQGALFIILVFFCVLLHEFGHVAAARRYGVKTPDITLYPFGGVASLERMPERPGQEIVVALAGPAVNVVIAGALWLFLGARFDLSDAAQLHDAQLSLMGRLAAVNVILVAFNLIPAFPTDGGRVLRALLAYRFDRVTATRYAAYAGQGFAALFVVAGLALPAPLLALIGVFIWLAAGAESQQVERRAVARGFHARDAMIRRFESLGPDSTAEDASRLLLLTTQQEFPVVSAGHELLGFVTRRGLIQAMKGGGPNAPVRDFMERDVPSTTEDEALERVMDALGRSASRAVAVRDRGGRFVGYVSGENLMELFMVDEARRAAV